MFKYALRQCKRNLEAIRAHQHAKSLFDKDMVSFWKHFRKESNARVPLATTIGGVTGETDFAEMWQDHYKSILNSEKGNSRQHFVTSKINSISDESILFSTSDINIALHSLKCGKLYGVLLQNTLSLLSAYLMYFYLFHLTLLFHMDICKQIL